ncbi:MAG: FAD-dependent oxidoreductase [Alphaproteobacteria bacterium]
MSEADVTATCDVIVVGGGGSGLAAALAAARAGRKVLVIEKAPQLGGTTALSVGTICATATSFQKAMRIVDAPDGQFEDMAKFAGPLVSRDNLALRRLLAENVPDTVRELADLGVRFTGPIPEPPHTYPRLHAIVPHSRGFIRQLAAECRKLGVGFRTGEAAQRLIAEAGRVVGVETSGADGTKKSYRCRKAVVMASGDFSSASRRYKERFMKGPLLDVTGVNPMSTGDGHRMAEDVGAKVVNGDLAWGPEIRFGAPAKPSIVSQIPPIPMIGSAILLAMKVLPDVLLRPLLMGYATTFLAPSHALFQEGAILVNAKGERFCDELNRPQDAIATQPGGTAFIILDAGVAEKFGKWPNFISTAPGVGYAYLPDYRRSRPDITFEAQTIEELAGRIGVDATALAATIQSYNAKLGAGDGARKPVATGPFTALGPARSIILLTEGGLAVNERLQVLREDGSVIAGLYAAGSAGQGGVILEGHGNHLGWAFTSGRLAGRNASAESV